MTGGVNLLVNQDIDGTRTSKSIEQNLKRRQNLFGILKREISWTKTQNLEHCLWPMDKPIIPFSLTNYIHQQHKRFN